MHTTAIFISARIIFQIFLLRLIGNSNSSPWSCDSVKNTTKIVINCFDVTSLSTRVPSKRIGFCLKKRLFRCRDSFQWKRSPKTQLFENALQSEIFWKRRFLVSVWTGENGTFRKWWRISFRSRLPARKKMAGYGDFMFLLCINRQGNMLGCQ